MAADRALDAVGVRGASGGRGYCWPPAAPPHQQVPTWGRPIHEVGAVGRSGGQVERIGGSMPGREGATTSLSLLHSSPSSSSCGGWLVVAASAAELFIWRGARGVGSPLHITRSHLSQVPRLESLRVADTNSGLVGRGEKTIQPKPQCCHTERGNAFANFGNSKIFYRIGTC